MIYEYAVSPSLFTNWQDLRFFLATFGGGHGRLLSDIPRKKWMGLAYSAIRDSNNGQVMKKRLVEGIKKLARGAIYRRNTAPELDSQEWIQHAIAAHQDRPFQAIITDCYDGESECVIRNEQSLIENKRWEIPSDQIIERRSQVMVEAISPMLDCAREVILMDRNFDPDKYRWRPFLIELAKFLSKRAFSPSINKLTFHVGDKFGAQFLELKCDTYLSSELPSGMTVAFVIRPWEELHDRYVLTDIGGVQFGIGLDIQDGSGPEKVRVSRISEGTWRQWVTDCRRKRPSFLCTGKLS
jgi:hypothetical protein